MHTMCRVLDVSSSGFYAWQGRAPSRHATDDAVLTERIRLLHAASDEIYGSPNIHAELRDQGTRVGRKRVARLMRTAGLRGVSRRRGFVVTTQRDRRQRPAPDLVNRSSPPMARTMPIRLTPKTPIGSVRAWRSASRQPCLTSSRCFLTRGLVAPIWRESVGRMASRAPGAARWARRTASRTGRRSCDAATASATRTSRRGPSCTRPARRCRSGFGERTS